MCGIRRRAAARTFTIHTVKALLKAANITLLSKTYTTSMAPIRVKCDKCGHTWKTPFHNLNPKKKKQNGCRLCGMKRSAEARRYTTKHVKNELSKMGIILLSKYEGSQRPIAVKHKVCGHTQARATWNELQSGSGCARCAKNARATDEDYAALARQFNGTLVRKAASASQESEWLCPIGHTFRRSYSTIKAQQTFCNVCSGSYAEVLCRMLVESLFEAPFHRVRVREMRSRKGTPLELDMFNEDLRIAVEHNGPHHYEPVGNWGGEAAYRIQKDNDERRRNYCAKNGILLIEIRQLGQRTTLERAKAQIRKALRKANMPLPPRFDAADPSTLVPKSETEAYWELVKKAAANLGLTILPCVYEGADMNIPVECEDNHRTMKTPRSILQGHKCDDCNSLRKKKAVRLSDGRLFESGAAAAKALGVTKEVVNKAAREGRVVKGLRVERA